MPPLAMSPRQRDQMQPQPLQGQIGAERLYSDCRPSKMTKPRTMAGFLPKPIKACYRSVIGLPSHLGLASPINGNSFYVTLITSNFKADHRGGNPSAARTPWRTASRSSAETLGAIYWRCPTWMRSRRFRLTEQTKSHFAQLSRGSPFCGR